MLRTYLLHTYTHIYMPCLHYAFISVHTINIYALLLFIYTEAKGKMLMHPAGQQASL